MLAWHGIMGGCARTSTRYRIFVRGGAANLNDAALEL
jgi:hypothetical protein